MPNSISKLTRTTVWQVIRRKTSSGIWKQKAEIRGSRTGSFSRSSSPCRYCSRNSSRRRGRPPFRGKTSLIAPASYPRRMPRWRATMKARLAMPGVAPRIDIRGLPRVGCGSSGRRFRRTGIERSRRSGCGNTRSVPNGPICCGLRGSRHSMACATRRCWVRRKLQPI